MAQAGTERPPFVVGPLGEALTLDALPPPYKPVHWVARRKAEVVAAVEGGLLSIEEACERYGISLEEFRAWKRAAIRSGMHGLRATYGGAYKKQWEREEREAEELRQMTRRLKSPTLKRRSR